MSRSRKYCLAILAFAWSLSYVLPVAAQEYDAVIYVSADLGKDSSAQSEQTANGVQFVSIAEALQHAVYVNKRSGLSSKIVVGPGTYRESVSLETFTNHPNNQPTNSTPILIEAEVPEDRPVVSGSDIWTDWTTDGSIYRKEWLFDWGVTDVRFGGIEVADIVLRREMVFVDGERLTPVAERALLEPGSFYVDEAIDSIFVFPVGLTHLDDRKVEIATRSTTWQQEYEDNVTLRGLVFEHAADPWLDGEGGVVINSSDGLTIEDCSFRNNNWTGLQISQATEVAVRRTEIVDNGGRGLAVWRLSGATIEDSFTLRNNWRGFLDRFTGWTVGNNVDSSHDVVFRRHTSTDNFARGLWLDTDIENVIIEESVFSNNENDGLFIEAAQGPVTVRNSVLRLNGRDGLFTGTAEKLTLEGNDFELNARSAIRVSGQNGGRMVTDFETAEELIVESLDWTMSGNRFFGTAPYLLGTTVDQPTWDNFVATLDSDFNDWCSPGANPVFQVSGGTFVSLDQWRGLTGQDANSTVCAGSVATDDEAAVSVDLDVAVYPNPSRESRSAVVRSGSVIRADVEVFDVLGRRVSAVRDVVLTAGSNEIDLTVVGLAAGNYMVVVRSADGMAARPFVITR